MKKTIMLIVFMLFAFTSIVNASDVYVNKNGVEIPIEKYEYLKQFFSELRINRWSQEDYNEVKDEEFYLIQSEDKFIATKMLVDSLGNEILSIDENISEEEYEANREIESHDYCDPGDDNVCWQTAYKRIKLGVACNSDRTICGFAVSLEWLKLPAARSYDVIAARWTGNFKVKDYAANLYYRTNGLLDGESYEPGYNENCIKKTSSGIGVSMKLPTNKTDLSAYFDVQGSLPMGEVLGVYATYQHAQSSLSLSDSMSYTFSENGLGNVLYYSNSTIRNKYDKMQGVSVPGFLWT